MALFRRLLFAIVLLSCRGIDGLDAKRTQSIERRNDAHAKSSSRLLQTQSWRTNNNYRNSGINPDGTTGEYYWKDRINRGLRNVGIVVVLWFVLVGTAGVCCRCYLCWESILMGNSLFRNNEFHGDGNHHEADRLDGVDMPTASSFHGHHVWVSLWPVCCITSLLNETAYNWNRWSRLSSNLFKAD